MNTTNEIYEAIEYLATLTPKQKEVPLNEYLENPVFRTVMRATLDPFVTYGIKKFKRSSNLQPGEYETLRTNMSAQDWEVLDDLAARKLTGNAAIAEVERIHRELHPYSAELFERILTKDLKAGFSATLVNKVRPGMIFVFECMLAHKYEESRIKQWPVNVEPKLDGIRVLAINKDDKGYRFFSRTGKEFKNFDHIAKVLNCVRSNTAVFDGEVVNKSGSFNETVGAAHRKGEQAESAVFYVFDILPLEQFEKGRWSVSAEARKQLLLSEIEGIKNNNGEIVAIEAKKAYSDNEIRIIYNQIRAEGGEGVIVKPRDGGYECKRSYNWLKIKDQQTADVIVTGLAQGTGKFAESLGALIVDFNGIEVNVGSGLTDQLREQFWSQPGEIIGKMVEVEFHEQTPVTIDENGVQSGGSLRHPRFVRIRDDKPIEDGIGC